MTLREVTNYLGFHLMRVDKLTREGRVASATIGSQWRFKRAGLDAWLEAQMSRIRPHGARATSAAHPPT